MDLRRLGRRLLAAAGIGLFMAPLLADAATADDVAGAVARKLGELGITEAGRVLMIDNALLARRAIVAGDFTTARRLITTVLGESRMQSWRFYPFDDFFAQLFADPPVEFGARLDQWVGEMPGDAIPLLLRARNAHALAWRARGDGYAASVSLENMLTFTAKTNAALTDIDAALALDATIPTAFALRLRILQGLGWSPRFMEAFREGIAQHPDYYPLYEFTLATLEPRWGGTITGMAALVDEYAGSSPQYSPLRMLYLSQYGSLLSTAGLSCGATTGNGPQVAGCIAAFMQRETTPELQGGVASALALYGHADRYEFGLVVKPIIYDMFLISGGEGFAEAALQQATEAMGANYITEFLAGEAMVRQKRYDDAVARWLSAAAMAGAAAFPSDDERRMALADIYEMLAMTLAPLGRHVDQIAFEQAAMRLGVPWKADVACQGYVMLADYAGAIATCSEAIDGTGNSLARYWRGTAYQQAGQQDAALTDFEIAADRGGYFTPYAAVAMSLIYFDRSDMQAALDVLNAYPAIYDAANTDRAQVAVAYNNRCYAYMQLGELRRALDDCTQSLRYGNLPQAESKRDELVARLNGSQ